jgi:hypothetical protein
MVSQLSSVIPASIYLLFMEWREFYLSLKFLTLGSPNPTLVGKGRLSRFYLS